MPPRHASQDRARTLLMAHIRPAGRVLSATLAALAMALGTISPSAAQQPSQQPSQQPAPATPPATQRGELSGVTVTIPPSAAPPSATPPSATPPSAPAIPPVTPPAAAGFGNTTVVPRSTGDGAATAAASQHAQIKLVALLTADGQRIDKGIVWRVFEDKPPRDGKPRMTNTLRDASPTLKLAPGEYLVNASFGRAHLTRKIVAKAGATTTEPFVLNAGGLRVTALLGTTPAPPNAVTYSILADERDQLNTRATVMAGAKPGLIIRLNAGLYQIVSTYGDANAVIRADVNVEAGKLTEATVAHSAAKVAFKLVNRAGGEALADTKWTIQTLQGELVKESVGALPMHHLAPGNYSAIAKSGGRAFRRDFSVQSGDNVEVEIVLK